MTDVIPPIPEVPPALREAAQLTNLIPFVGAGASKLAGCPDWNEFADDALRVFVEHGKFSHAQLDQVKTLSPRVKLAIALALQAEHQIQIDFRRILHRKERAEHAIGCRLYSYLSKLGKTFVTTNYDEWLDEEIVPPTTDVGGEAGGSADVAPQARTIYFRPEDLTAANLNRQDVVIHLHGSVRYWKALDYLIACAKVADEHNDAALAERILSIVRTVSAERDPAGERANFHTFRRFAEILGLLPTSSVTAKDLGLVEGWLNTKFDHDMVANAIDGGALSRFLSSSFPADWDKAVQLFKCCTAIRWQPDRLDSETQEPVTIVEGHWLKELVNNRATALGRKAGASAASLMADRVREVFGKGGRADWSHVFRPAVEDEGQSHVGRGAENIVVEALRDVLLGWTEIDGGAAKPFVQEVLRSDNEMLRRVGIHVLNERWEAFRELYLPLVRPELFDVGHLHELYRLLNLRFESFTKEESEATIAAIRSIPVPEGDEEAQGRIERLQFRWLSAIPGTAYEPAAKWFGQLTAKYGSPPKHPDYVSYIETRWGPGPSQYGAEELVALAEQRTLVQKLAAFKPGDSWEGPTVDALTDQLERAVQLAPVAFIRVLPDLLAASITYQHAVIAGFLKLWREPNAERPFDGWEVAAPKLFEFFEALLANPTFWDVKSGAHGFREVTPMWVASSIADLLQAGTRDDSRAYSKRMPVLKLVHDVRAESMKVCAGLQVADFLAWHTNRDIENKERPERDLNAALRRVLTARCVADVYNYEKLLELYDKWRPAPNESS